MRAIATLVLLGLVAARPAAAEPPAPGDKKQSQPAKGKQKEKPAEPAASPAVGPGFGLGSMAAQAAGSATPPDTDRERGKAEARRLDLTPQRQFQKLGDPRGKERRSGVGLGDDGDWVVHAVQVGAMVGLFSALVAICADGGCLLPELFGGQDRLGPAPGVGLRQAGEPRDAR